jgi:hypothetical protein
VFLQEQAILKMKTSMEQRQDHLLLLLVLLVPGSKLTSNIDVIMPFSFSFPFVTFSQQQSITIQN